MKPKLFLGLFAITVVFAFSSKQLVDAVSLNHSNPEISGLINSPTGYHSKIKEEPKQGKIKFFNEKEGFGYIIDGTTGENYEFAKSDCIDGYKPKQNDDVSFELKQGKKGVKAINVKARK